MNTLNIWNYQLAFAAGDYEVVLHLVEKKYLSEMEIFLGLQVAIDNNHIQLVKHVTPCLTDDVSKCKLTNYAFHLSRREITLWLVKIGNYVANLEYASPPFCELDLAYVQELGLDVWQVNLARMRAGDFDLCRKLIDEAYPMPMLQVLNLVMARSNYETLVKIDLQSMALDAATIDRYMSQCVQNGTLPMLKRLTRELMPLPVTRYFHEAITRGRYRMAQYLCQYMLLDELVPMESACFECALWLNSKTMFRRLYAKGLRYADKPRLKGSFERSVAIAYLIEQGVDIASQASELMITAIQNGNTELITFLVARYGSQLLDASFAACQNSTRCDIEFLISQGLSWQTLMQHISLRHLTPNLRRRLMLEPGGSGLAIMAAITYVAHHKKLPDPNLIPTEVTMLLRMMSYAK